jgi:hypothetical protein
MLHRNVDFQGKDYTTIHLGIAQKMEALRSSETFVCTEDYTALRRLSEERHLSSSSCLIAAGAGLHVK